MAGADNIRSRDAKGRILSNNRSAPKPNGGVERDSFIDPGAAGAAAGDAPEPGSARSRRPDPRPPGGAGEGAAAGAKGPAGAKAKGASLDLSSLAGVLQGCHAIIAFQRAEPHWLLNDPDAARYALAVSNAMRHLPIKVAQKAVDYTAFAMVAFSIESPRIIRSAQLAGAKPGRPPQRGPAEVFRFTGGPGGAPGPSPAPGGPSGGPGGPAGGEAPPPFAQDAAGFGLAEDDPLGAA